MFGINTGGRTQGLEGLGPSGGFPTNSPGPAYMGFSGLGQLHGIGPFGTKPSLDLGHESLYREANRKDTYGSFSTALRKELDQDALIDKTFGEYDSSIQKLKEELALSERARLELEKENRDLKSQKTSSIGGMEELVHLIALRNKEEEFARYQSKLFMDSQQSQEREKMLQSLITRNSELEKQVGDLQKAVANLGMQLGTREKSTTDSDRLASTLHKEYFALKEQALKEIAKRDAEIVTLRQDRIASMAALQDSDRRRIQEVESFKQRAESGYRELQLLNDSLQQRNTDLEKRLAEISGAFQSGQTADEKAAKQFFGQLTSARLQSGVVLSSPARGFDAHLEQQTQKPEATVKFASDTKFENIQPIFNPFQGTSGIQAEMGSSEASRENMAGRFGAKDSKADLDLMNHPLAILLPNRPFN